MFIRTTFEMQQRASFLRRDVEAWNEMAENNINQFGLHRSQVKALKAMMLILLRKQDEYLNEFNLSTSLQDYAAAYRKLTIEMVGLNDLWSIFRYIFSQLLDSQLSLLLDDANWVAADCYTSWIKRAREFQLISEEKSREPPLVYLVAELSPTIINRSKQIRSLNVPVRTYGTLRLPIPIVILPIDQIGLPWLFCNLHHEVGHSVDQDIGLSEELEYHLKTRLSSRNIPEARCIVWERWVSEIIADGLAILSCGAGFCHAISSLLVLLCPQWPIINDQEVHPNPYIRIALLSSLIDNVASVTLQPTSGEISSLLQSLPKPMGADAFLSDCPYVAEVIMAQRLEVLDNRQLRDLNPNLDEEVKQVAQLAKYFDTGSGFDKPNEPLPARLIPSAAELTFVKMVSPDTDVLLKVNERTIHYLRSLRRPDFLVGGNVDAHREFLNQLSEKIDFMEITE